MKQWIAFAIATVGWAAYFYGVDFLIMEGQGLPVNALLMPQ